MIRQGFRLSDLSLHIPLIIAHRGYSARYLENTLEAFRGAMDAGADLIAMDLHLTRDGRLVVIHDATTARVSREKVRISRSNLNRIQKVRLKKGFGVPTLEEVLDMVTQKIPLNLELKAKGTGIALARFLQTKGTGPILLVSSYKTKELKDFHSVCPGVPLARIYTQISPEDLARDARAGRFSVHISHNHLKKETVEMAHRLGLKVFSFTVDEPGEMVKLFSWGIDGIFTNEPSMAIEVARSHGFR